MVKMCVYYVGNGTNLHLKKATNYKKQEKCKQQTIHT